MKKYLFIVLLFSLLYPNGEIRLNVKYDGKPIKAKVNLSYISDFGDKEDYGYVGTTNEYGNLLIKKVKVGYDRDKRLKNGKHILSIPAIRYYYKDKKGKEKYILLKPVEKTVIVRGGGWKTDKKRISI